MGVSHHAFQKRLIIGTASHRNQIILIFLALARRTAHLMPGRAKSLIKRWRPLMMRRRSLRLVVLMIYLSDVTVSLGGPALITTFSMISRSSSKHKLFPPDH